MQELAETKRKLFIEYNDNLEKKRCETYTNDFKLSFECWLKLGPDDRFRTLFNPVENIDEYSITLCTKWVRENEINTVIESAKSCGYRVSYVKEYDRLIIEDDIIKSTLLRNRQKTSAHN